MFNNKIVLSLSVAVIGFVVGFFLCNYIYANKEVVVSFNDCKEVALKRLTETGYVEPERLSPQNIKFVSGVVKSLESSAIILSIKPLSPLADPVLDERRIVLSAETEISKSVKKDASEYKKEMEDFNENGTKTAEGSDAPFFYKNIKIGLNDLSVGDSVMVESADNIEEAKKILAKKIIVK